MKKRRTKNPVAKKLRTPEFRARTTANRLKYNRKSSKEADQRTVFFDCKAAKLHHNK